jgi:hypothetical protein
MRASSLATAILVVAAANGIAVWPQLLNLRAIPSSDCPVGCNQTPRFTLVTSAMAREPFETLASAKTAPIALGAGPVQVTLAPDKDGAALASRLKETAPRHKLYLVLRGLRADGQPEVLYDVHLDLPPGAPPDRNEPSYVGSLDFFNASGYASESSSRFYSYDVSDAVRRLKTRDLLREPITVTIVPTAKPAKTAKPPLIGEIALVEQ